MVSGLLYGLLMLVTLPIDVIMPALASTHARRYLRKRNLFISELRCSRTSILVPDELFMYDYLMTTLAETAIDEQPRSWIGSKSRVKRAARALKNLASANSTAPEIQLQGLEP